jgi:hypothetical protein
MVSMYSANNLKTCCLLVYDRPAVQISSSNALVRVLVLNVPVYIASAAEV